MGGFCNGEPEMAIRLAGSADGMLVIMDRAFAGVALWRAYTGARAHLLIRAKSCIATRPIEHLGDGTYLARMNLAGQKRAAPGTTLLANSRERRGARSEGGEVRCAGWPEGYAAVPGVDADEVDRAGGQDVLKVGFV